VLLSANPGQPHQGGTCFGDSGGPAFDDTDSNLVVAVTSFGFSSTCSGVGGAYRLDQPDDLAFLASFGITPDLGELGSFGPNPSSAADAIEGPPALAPEAPLLLARRRSGWSSSRARQSDRAHGIARCSHFVGSSERGRRSEPNR